VVSVFTLTIGLSLAEICSAYPTTGGLYFWTIKILEGRVINGVKVGSPDWVPLASWIVGYTNWLGLVRIGLIAIFDSGPLFLNKHGVTKQTFLYLCVRV